MNHGKEARYARGLGDWAHNQLGTLPAESPAFHRQASLCDVLEEGRVVKITIVQNDDVLAESMADLLESVVGSRPIVSGGGHETRVFTFSMRHWDGRPSDEVLHVLFAGFNGMDPRTPKFLTDAYSEAGFCSMCNGHIIVLEHEHVPTIDPRRTECWLCKPDGWDRIR